MAQAEDRAHRIGQANSVLVQHVVVNGSFDATMCVTVAEKSEVIEGALDTVADADEQMDVSLALPECMTDAPAKIETAETAALVESPTSVIVSGVTVTSESLPEPETGADESLPEPLAAVVATRPRGRPKKEGGAKSRADITRDYRTRNAVSKLEVSGALAERVRAMRTGRGVTIEALLARALDALETCG